MCVMVWSAIARCDMLGFVVQWFISSRSTHLFVFPASLTWCLRIGGFPLDQFHWCRMNTLFIMFHHVFVAFLPYMVSIIGHHVFITVLIYMAFIIFRRGRSQRFHLFMVCLWKHAPGYYTSEFYDFLWNACVKNFVRRSKQCHFFLPLIFYPNGSAITTPP